MQKYLKLDCTKSNGKNDNFKQALIIIGKAIYTEKHKHQAQNNDKCLEKGKAYISNVAKVSKTEVKHIMKAARYKKCYKRWHINPDTFANVFGQVIFQLENLEYDNVALCKVQFKKQIKQDYSDIIVSPNKNAVSMHLKSPKKFRGNTYGNYCTNLSSEIKKKDKQLI